MRKHFAIILPTLFLTLSIWAQPNKIVLIEEGTGTGCQWCPRGDIYGQEILKTHRDKVVYIAVHGFNSSDPMYYGEYADAVGFFAYPSASFDRKTVTDTEPAFALADVDAALDEIPPANISVETIWDVDTRNITMTITAEMFEDLSGDYRLAAIVIEDGVTGPAPHYDQSNAYANNANGPMGGYELLPSPVPANIMVYNHTARHLAGGFNGDQNSLPPTLVSGEKYSYTYEWILPDDYDEGYIRIAGLMIDGTNGTVINAGQSAYLPGNVNGKPFFHSEGKELAFTGLLYEYDIVCHDPEHEVLQLSQVTLPSWLSLTDEGEGRGRLTGQPDAEGEYEISISVTDGNHVTYQNFTIIVKKAEEDWIQLGPRGFSTFNSTFSDIQFDADGNLYLYNASFNADAGEVFKFENGNWQPLGPRLNGINAFQTAFAISPDGKPYIASDASVYSLNNDAWELLGGSPFGTGRSPAMVVTDDGTLYAISANPPNSTSAATWDGSQWHSMDSGFADGPVTWCKMKIGKDGLPIAIYGTDGSNILYSEVAQYDGITWNVLGNDYVEPSAQTYFEHDIAVGPDGEIYAALIVGFDRFLHIYKLENDAWIEINSDLAGGIVEGPNIEVDAKGNVIVSFQDDPNGSRISTMIFDGTDWRYLGVPGFTDIAGNPALELDHNDIPYVSYTDLGSSERVSVKKYQDLTTSIFSAYERIEGLKIFPNPNEGNFNLEYSEGGIYQILDCTGRCMAEGVLEKNTIMSTSIKTITTHQLKAGIYFLKVISKNKTGVISFIKN